MQRSTYLKRKTPLLRSGKRIRKQTPAHRAEQVEWQRLKRQAITEQIEFADFAACEGDNCPVRFWTVETAMEGLEAHHKTFRSHGGASDRANQKLLCRDCHDRAHLLKAPALPLDDGGFDTEDGNERANVFAVPVGVRSTASRDEQVGCGA